ncbi:pilus assembly protein N-terminal domain-containing protein [Bradyrhizobium elkanii]|uniref:pilus assembly protein N-terminal domain-containing protein n=1 Tax=Bradyrhizobium elkanii TaxID=29448 RepID=UPI00209DF9A5|nr:pilus assembly protein N-terminal domain-containing protein [Bradyrhizobium elkanii]
MVAYRLSLAGFFMKQFLSALPLVLLILSSPVLAQSTTARDPSPQGPGKGEVISAVEQLHIAPGQAKLIKFNRMIGDIQTSVNNVVRSSVLGDKFLLSVTGVSAGSTDLIVVNQYGDVMYIGHVTVSPGLETDGDVPHIVRMYGWSEGKRGAANFGTIVNITNGDSKAAGAPTSDYVEIYCSSTGCGQPISRGNQGAGLDATDPQKERQ